MEDNMTEWQYFRRGCNRVIKWCVIGALVGALAFFVSNVIGYWLVRLDWNFLPELGSFGQYDSFWGRASLLAAIGMAHAALCAGITLIAGYALYVAYVCLLYIGGYRDSRSSEQADSAPIKPTEHLCQRYIRHRELSHRDRS